MAKQLKSIVKYPTPVNPPEEAPTFEAPLQKGIPGVDLKPISGDEQKFAALHVVKTIPDRNGNGDELFKGTKVKIFQRALNSFGYDAEQSANAEFRVSKEIQKKSFDSFLDMTSKIVAKEEENLDEASEHPSYNKLVNVAKSHGYTYDKKATSHFKGRHYGFVYSHPVGHSIILSPPSKFLDGNNEKETYAQHISAKGEFSGWKNNSTDLDDHLKNFHSKFNEDVEIENKKSIALDKKKEITEHIVKLGKKFCLLSHKGKNLGTFDSHAAAAKHEGEVEYFKHNESVTEAVSKEDLAKMMADFKSKGGKAKRVEAGTVTISKNALYKAMQSGERVQGGDAMKVDPHSLAPSATFKGTWAGTKHVKEDIDIDTQATQDYVLKQLEHKGLNFKCPHCQSEEIPKVNWNKMYDLNNEAVCAECSNKGAWPSFLRESEQLDEYVTRSRNTVKSGYAANPQMGRYSHDYSKAGRRKVGSRRRDPQGLNSTKKFHIHLAKNGQWILTSPDGSITFGKYGDRNAALRRSESLRGRVRVKSKGMSKGKMTLGPKVNGEMAPKHIEKK